MKKTIFITFFSIAIIMAADAKSKVIENPDYSFKASGIYNISKIELDNKETRVYIQTTFIPGWWVMFTQKHFLEDTKTGKKFYAERILGGNFDEQIPMPESGDSSFVLVFPALSKEIESVTYGEENKKNIFDISLTKAKRNRNISTQQGVPPEIDKWMAEELAKDTKQSPDSFTRDNFFSQDSTRIVGYIKGYDQRAGFTTGLIYCSNIFTTEDFPIVGEILPDGRFEFNIPMQHPKKISMVLGSQWVSAYVEPGISLGVIIDWEDYLMADRKRNIDYKFEKTEFRGQLREVNNEILNNDLKRIDWEESNSWIGNLDNEEVKSRFGNLLDENLSEIEDKKADKKISKKTAEILTASEYSKYGYSLLSYAGSLSYRYQQEPENHKLKPAGLEFYDFLNNIPMDDPTLLVDNFSEYFVNQLEYSNPFMGRYEILNTRTVPELNFNEYLLTEVDPNLIDAETYAMLQNKELQGTDYEKIKEKYLSYYEDYKTIYLDPLPSKDELVLKAYRYEDSVYKNVLKLDPGLVQNIIKTRRMKYDFENFEKEKAKRLLTDVLTNVQDRFMGDQMIRLFNHVHPPVERTAYELPEGKGTDIFRKIIDPYKGKVLVVDFWATSCGPCVANIKQTIDSRREMAAKGKIEFLFITDERGTPSHSYGKFVEENELTHSFRLPVDDYNYLRQLFKFNGIPRYVLIDEEGRVVDENFNIHMIRSELADLLANN